MVEKMTAIQPWEFKVTTNVLELIAMAGVPLSLLEKERLSIKQNAFIKVGKEGVEAAPVTVAAGLDCIEERPKVETFAVNRPFISRFTEIMSVSSLDISTSQDLAKNVMSERK